MKGRNSLAELVTCKNRHVDAIGGEVSIAFLARRSSHLVDTKLVRYPRALYQLVMATVDICVALRLRRELCATAYGPRAVRLWSQRPTYPVAQVGSRDGAAGRPPS